MKTLVIDVGGTHIKLRVQGQEEVRKIPSGPTLTPREMIESVRTATKDWSYDRVTIGYPGPVVDGVIQQEPVNLGDGWMGFDFAKALGQAVKLINDAAMQALGSYEGGRMLFLGLGTGLGSALVYNNFLLPMELGHLPYKKGYTYEEYVGQAGLKELGRRKWKSTFSTWCNASATPSCPITSCWAAATPRSSTNCRPPAAWAITAMPSRAAYVCGKMSVSSPHSPRLPWVKFPPASRGYVGLRLRRETHVPIARHPADRLPTRAGRCWPGWSFSPWSASSCIAMNRPVPRKATV